MTESRTAYYFPVHNLNIGTSWRVGRVVLRPAGQVRANFDSALARLDEASRPIYEQLLDESSKWTACAEVRLTQEPDLKDKTQVPRLRKKVDDALAVVRLYVEVAGREGPWDLQGFGWESDLGIALARYVALREGRIVQSGSAWQGGAFPVTLDDDQCADFAADPRFRFLSRLTAVARPTPFQRRLLTAVRTFGIGLLPQPDAVRVILLATALEAILGDDKSFDRAHRIAQRSAFFTCIPPNGRSHAAGRPTCLYMRSKSTDVVEAFQRLRADEGLEWECTAYTSIRSLFRHRNNAVHRGQTEFEPKAMVWHRIRTGEVILAVTAWMEANRSAPFADIDRGIAALPVS